MAWWNRSRQSPRLGSVVRLSQPIEGLVASVQRLDLDKPADRAKLAKSQEQWQTDAAYYLDSIGELVDARRFVENSFRRISLFAAYLRDADEQPVPVSDAVPGVNVETRDRPFEEDREEPTDTVEQKWADLADSIVAGFAARDGGQQVLTARLGVNLFGIGEAYIIQRAVPDRVVDPADGDEAAEMVWDWEVRSPGELRQSKQDRRVIETIDSPDQRDGRPIEGVGADPPFVERIWRKHWGWSGWADSNLRGAVDTCEELRLLGLVARASLRSRAMAGIFTVPDEIDFGGAESPDGSTGTRKAPAFDRDLAEAMAAGIGNEADPNTVAPLIVRASKDFLSRDVFGPIELPRRYGADEREQREQAVLRLGRTIELPVEKLTGVSDVNHWTAWAVDEDTYRAYIEPLANIVSEALTYGLLRPQLLAESCPPEVVERLVVSVDASNLVRRADKGKIADTGVTNLALSWEAWRRANQFGDDDAPTLQEIAVRFASQNRLDPAILLPLLVEAGIISEDVADEAKAAKEAATPPAPVVVAPPGEDVVDGPPAQEPPVAVAAAAFSATTTGQRLAMIDSTLRERLTVLADGAVHRALERAGNRLRSNRTSTVRAAVAAAGDVPAASLARHVTPTAVLAALGPDPIGADDFEGLRERFESWTRASQDAAIRELARLAGRRGVSDATLNALRADQADDRDRAWSVLLAALVAYASARLTSAEDEREGGGEFDATASVRPSLLREALAVAGGTAVVATALGGLARATNPHLPVPGVATGDRMAAALAETGYRIAGYEWSYGAEPRATPFEEHLALDGAPMDEWDEFRPGDHGFCRCDSVPIVEELTP